MWGGFATSKLARCLLVAYANAVVSVGRLLFVGLAQGRFTAHAKHNSQIH